MHALVLWPVNANCPGFRGGIPEKKVSGFLTNTGSIVHTNVHFLKIQLEECIFALTMQKVECICFKFEGK